MEITQVNIHKVDREDSRLRAYANITIDNCLAIHNIKVIEGEEKLFIAMPSRTVKDSYQDIVHPTNAETRKLFEDTIIEAYKNS